jgi:hypothetical protein
MKEDESMDITTSKLLNQFKQASKEEQKQILEILKTRTCYFNKTIPWDEMMLLQALKDMEC